MNRLQKKCFIASAGFHLLLLLILFVGPAFFSGSKPRNTEVLTFFDLSKVTDGPTTGTGNPNPIPPAPQPQIREIVQPAPQLPIAQPIVKPRVPAPQPEPEKEVKSNERNPFAEKPPTKPQVSTRIVKGTTAKPTNSPTKDNAEAKTREQAARLAAELRSAASILKNSLSKGTAFEMPGTGGQASVNWAQAVVSIYYDAWIPPAGLEANDEVNTKVSVTIAANGDVVSARIINASGNAVADDSVQRTLNRVKSAAPLPAGSKDKQRTIVIIFNPAVKKLAG